MRAVLRRLHSPDAYDLNTWKPDDTECFALLLQAIVSPEGSEGEESFDFIVCTPEWLKRNYGTTGVVLGRHHLIVFEYDFGRIRAQIESIISQAVGENWDEVAGFIARHGKWEFEDYRPE